MSDPEPVLISASQLATFQDCPVKWGYDKLDGREREESDAANQGTAIHSEVEAWFDSGVAPSKPESLALLQHLPARGEPGLRVEAPISFVWPGVDVPVLVRGYMDLFRGARAGGRPKVWDHKSTSRKKYIKTADDLKGDAQVVCYGVGARLETVWAGGELPDEVDFQWTYVIREQPKTRAPYTEPVEFTQNLTDLESGLRRWSPVVAAIAAAHQIPKGEKPRALQLHPDQAACHKYGGCPHRFVCPHYVGKPEPEPEVKPVSPEMRARLAAASAQAPRPLPSAEPTPPPMASEFTPPKMGLIDTLRIQDVPAQVVPPDAQPNVSVNDPPPPPLVEVAPKRRGRPPKDRSVAPPPAPAPLAQQISAQVDPSKSLEGQQVVLTVGPTPPPAAVTVYVDGKPTVFTEDQVEAIKNTTSTPMVPGPGPDPRQRHVVSFLTEEALRHINMGRLDQAATIVRFLADYQRMGG